MWPVLTPAELLHDLFGSGRCCARPGAASSPRRTSTPCTAPVGGGRRRRVDRRRRAAARRGAGPPRADAAGQAAGRGRRGPHLRPHRGRRGPGPLADAAAHADPPLAQRLDDRRRRHRPVDRAPGPTPTGTRCCACCPIAGRHAGPSSRSATASPRRTWRSRPACWPRRRPTCARRGRCARTVARRCSTVAPQDELLDAVAEAVLAERDEVGRRQRGGRSARARWSRRCRPRSSGPASSTAWRLQQGLDHQVTVVPVGLVKGLELDATVVVEPAAIVDEEPQGMRALYVALTRATKRPHGRARPSAPVRARGRRRRTVLQRWRSAQALTDAASRRGRRGRSGQVLRRPSPSSWTSTSRSAPATVVALLGPSGCGKTTLLRIDRRPRAARRRRGQRSAGVCCPATRVCTCRPSGAGSAWCSRTGRCSRT